MYLATRTTYIIQHATLATGGAAARAELGLADNYYDTSAGQRERMLNTTAKLDKTTDRISQGRAQLAETEVRSDVGRLCMGSSAYSLLLLDMQCIPKV